MKLTIVGCGDAFASGGRGNACFRLDAGAAVLAVDFGASALVGWRRLGFSPADIDAVAISHLHGDHFGGLPFLLIERQYGGGPQRPLTIVGPRGLGERLGVLMAALYPRPSPRDWAFALDIREIEIGASLRVAGLDLTAFAMDHPSGGDALGLRFSDGATAFAYSGDTGWTEALVDLARDADLLLVECSGALEPLPAHLDWRGLKEKLPRLAARRIVLTHMSEAARTLENDMRQSGVELADEGLAFDI